MSPSGEKLATPCLFGDHLNFTDDPMNFTEYSGLFGDNLNFTGDPMNLTENSGLFGDHLNFTDDTLNFTEDSSLSEDHGSITNFDEDHNNLDKNITSIIDEFNSLTMNQTSLSKDLKLLTEEFRGLAQDLKILNRDHMSLTEDYKMLTKELNLDKKKKMELEKKVNETMSDMDFLHYSIDDQYNTSFTTYCNNMELWLPLAVTSSTFLVLLLLTIPLSLLITWLLDPIALTIASKYILRCCFPLDYLPPIWKERKEFLSPIFGILKGNDSTSNLQEMYLFELPKTDDYEHMCGPLCTSLCSKLSERARAGMLLLHISKDESDNETNEESEDELAAEHDDGGGRNGLSELENSREKDLGLGDTNEKDPRNVGEYRQKNYPEGGNKNPPKAIKHGSARGKVQLTQRRPPTKPPPQRMHLENLADETILGSGLHLHCLSCYSSVLCTRDGDWCKFVECPNKCGSVYHFCKETEHSQLCAEAAAPCINSAYGCPARMPRKDIGMHLSRCVAMHSYGKKEPQGIDIINWAIDRNCHLLLEHIFDKLDQAVDKVTFNRACKVVNERITGSPRTINLCLKNILQQPKNWGFGVKLRMAKQQFSKARHQPYNEVISETLIRITGISGGNKKVGLQHDVHLMQIELGISRGNATDMCEALGILDSIHAWTPLLRRCKALFDCKAENDDELSFKKGDIIVILNEKTADKNWMKGYLESDVNKRRGLFPASYVRVLK